MVVFAAVAPLVAVLLHGTSVAKGQPRAGGRAPGRAKGTEAWVVHTRLPRILFHTTRKHFASTLNYFKRLPSGGLTLVDPRILRPNTCGMRVRRAGDGTRAGLAGCVRLEGAGRL